MLITIGADGALLDGEVIPAPPVDVVDTTGAGDTVNGALAARLAAGDPLRDAVAFALAAASLSTRFRRRPRRDAAARGRPRRAVIRRALIGAGAAAAVYAGWIEPRRLVTVRETLALPSGRSRSTGCASACSPTSTPARCTPGPADRPRRAAAQRRGAGRDPAARRLHRRHPLWGGRVDPPAIAHELADLRAPLGVFAVLGNHDWKQAGDRMWTALRDAGITVLENRAVQAGDVHIAGLADLRMRRPDLPPRSRRSPPERPRSCSPTTPTCSRSSPPAWR